MTESLSAKRWMVNNRIRLGLFATGLLKKAD